MREIIEDALIVYRQELESLQLIVAPAVVLGPVFVIAAGTGLTASIVMLPFFLALYLATYAACVAAAGAVFANHEPLPSRVYLQVLGAMPRLATAAAPAGLLLAGVFGAALVVSDVGFPYVGALFGLGSAAAGLWWAVRHAYDVPLIVNHDLKAEEAVQIGYSFSRDELMASARLLGVLSLPVVLLVLVAWLFGSALSPVVGAGIFVLGLALWLPLPALALSNACGRLVDDVNAAPAVPDLATPAYRPRY